MFAQLPPLVDLGGGILYLTLLMLSTAITRTSLEGIFGYGQLFGSSPRPRICLGHRVSARLGSLSQQEIAAQWIKYFPRAVLAVHRVCSIARAASKGLNNLASFCQSARDEGI
jgi:hypothetical protein